MSRTFTLDAYARLLLRLRELGYENVEFSVAAPTEKHLIVRHDIDMSIDSALRMAEVESGLGIAADYFVLLRSELYNAFSAEAEKGIRRIVSLGHRVGLHFDASIYPEQNVEDLDRFCAAECSLLESWFGLTVGMVSFHRPVPALLGLARGIGGRAHTYEPRFFEMLAYCADSRGGWHHGHPLDLLRARGWPALQLLTHPVWWDSRDGENPVERLDRLAADRDDRYRHELARNCRPYAEARATRLRT